MEREAVVAPTVRRKSRLVLDVSFCLLIMSLLERPFYPNASSLSIEGLYGFVGQRRAFY
jgi:hypothetical protein